MISMRQKLILIAAALAVLTAGCNGGPGGVTKSKAFLNAEALYLQTQFPEARRAFLDVYGSDAYADRRWRQETLYYLARCDQMTGKLADALAVYNDILKYPTYGGLKVRALACRADIRRDLGLHRLAAEDYTKALRMIERGVPGVPGSEAELVDVEKLLFGKGLSLWAMDRTRDSDAVFDQYMNRFPDGRFLDTVKAHHTKFGGVRPVTPFYVLVQGRFRLRAGAEALARKLKAKGYQARVERSTMGNATVYEVRVGAFDTRHEAWSHAKELEAAGFGPTEDRP